MSWHGKSSLHCAALALAVLPGQVLAALDDQGMQYVTAAEGLHGSLRVNVLQIDRATTTSGGEEQSLRLWVRGSADLGGSLLRTSHYYWEVRADDAEGSVNTYAFELGISGTFGTFTFGQLDMVAPRLVPNADLNLARDSNLASFASEPGANSLRYETPTYRGFSFGASAQLEEQPGADPAVDEYSLAARLTVGSTLELGAGYENRACWRVLQGSSCLPKRQTDLRGWRAGIRYTNDRWRVAYEHRAYTAFEAFEVGSAIGIPFRPGTDTRLTTYAATPLPIVATGLSLDHYAGYDYLVDAIGIQGRWPHLTVTANYSIEKLELPQLDDFFTSPNPAVVNFRFLAPAADLQRRTISLELSHSLGSRAMLALGWQRVNKDELATTGNTAADAATVLATTTDTATYLFYRLDF